VGDRCGLCSSYCRGLHRCSKTKTTGKHLLCRCNMPCFICMHMVHGHEYGDLTCFTGRLQGKPASGDKQESKRRASKHPEGPTTGTGKTLVQTGKAPVNNDKAAQGDAKQPAGQTTSATGLIAAFRPVEQLPASSAAASLPASAAGSNASRDLQEFEFISHLDALLLRAKVLRLEPAHRPKDAREKESAGTSAASQHLPWCCSASLAILCPLFESLLFRTLLQNSNVELASFITTFCICDVESRPWKMMPEADPLLAEPCLLLQSALSAWRGKAQLMKRLLPPMMLLSTWPVPCPPGQT